MQKKIEDSLEIVIQTGICISLKEGNVISFLLKNLSYSSLTFNTSRIAPGPISDSGGHNISQIGWFVYSTTMNDTITLEPGAEREISFKTKYFSQYDLKTGQPYYVSGFYISPIKINNTTKGPLTKFYLCDK